MPGLMGNILEEDSRLQGHTGHHENNKSDIILLDELRLSPQLEYYENKQT